MKAVILVGGPSRGTRFRPLSLNVPKPLFPIANQPMIYHHIAALAQLADMKEILIIGFFEPAQFQPFVQQVSEQFPKLSVRYLREYQSLGTGGGLYHFRDQILRAGGGGQATDRFFVMHGDVCSSFPLSQMVTFHEKHGGICTILGTRVPKENSTRYGCIVSDGKSQQVLHYVEKPETFVSDLISCGVYLFDTAIFKEMEVRIAERHAIAAAMGANDISSNGNVGDILRLEQDILRPMAGNDHLFVYETREFWRQIKSAGGAIPANKLCLYNYHKVSPQLLAPQKKDSLANNDSSSGQAGPTIIGDVTIHPSAQIDPTAKIGPNVSICARAVIGKGVSIKESIILDNVEVKPFSCILYSIIGWNSKIGSWCRIEGTPAYSDMGNSSPAANFSDMGGSVSTVPSTNLMLPNGTKNQSVTILGQEVTVSDDKMVRNCIVLPHKELRNSCCNDILM